MLGQPVRRSPVISPVAEEFLPRSGSSASDLQQRWWSRDSAGAELCLAKAQRQEEDSYSADLIQTDLRFDQEDWRVLYV